VRNQSRPQHELNKDNTCTWNHCAGLEAPLGKKTKVEFVKATQTFLSIAVIMHMTSFRRVYDFEYRFDKRA
jgi:hypothetical protein